jgi:hypothetical protein
MKQKIAFVGRRLKRTTNANTSVVPGCRMLRITTTGEAKQNLLQDANRCKNQTMKARSETKTHRPSQVLKNNPEHLLKSVLSSLCLSLPPSLLLRAEHRNKKTTNENNKGSERISAPN